MPGFRRESAQAMRLPSGARTSGLPAIRSWNCALRALDADGRLSERYLFAVRVQLKVKMDGRAITRYRRLLR